MYDNVMSDSTRYGVFFYRGSDEAEVSYLIVYLARGGLLLMFLMKFSDNIKYGVWDSQNGGSCQFR